ncbi:hypothetical protein ACJJTC_005084 [Scirpophaga incertulas]
MPGKVRLLRVEAFAVFDCPQKGVPRKKGSCPFREERKTVKTGGRLCGTGRSEGLKCTPVAKVGLRSLIAANGGRSCRFCDLKVNRDISHRNAKLGQHRENAL